LPTSRIDNAGEGSIEAAVDDADMRGLVPRFHDYVSELPDNLGTRIGNTFRLYNVVEGSPDIRDRCPRYLSGMMSIVPGLLLSVID
jgi:hypothetical protein